MGGRGSSSFASSVTVMTEDEYLGTLGLNSPFSDYMIDKVRLPHGETQRQKELREKEANKEREDYSQRRQQAKQEYQSMVASGQVRPPTKIEQLLKVASGLGDKESVIAARRVLEKRGYDWRSGKRIF